MSHTHSEESAGSHTHKTITLKNKAGTADITATGGISGDNYAQFTPWAYQSQLETSGRITASGTNKHSYNTSDAHTGSNVRIDLAHTHNMEHSHTTDSQGSHTHTINAAGGSEARPVDYTYKIWKRIA